jgi:hypothetical protein
MFEWLLARPTSLFTFLSGMFMSVATTALSNFALAAESPANIGRLVKCAIVSFLAAATWFWIGEFIVILKERVRVNADGVVGSDALKHEKAMGTVRSDSRHKLYLSLFAAIAFSMVWPFV